MYIIYQLNFTELQEYYYFYLDLFTLLSIIFSILVITNKNPIVSVLFLICLFVCIAGYLLMIGLKFIGLSYLLVYIGAVSILFLFILMLINIRISEIQTETINSLPLALLISVYICVILYDTTPSNGTDVDYSNSDLDNNNPKESESENESESESESKSESKSETKIETKIRTILNDFNSLYSIKSLYSASVSANKVSNVVYNEWDTNVVEILHISSIGNILYSNYLLWLVLTSIILLLAMVGTIIITIKQQEI